VRTWRSSLLWGLLMLTGVLALATGLVDPAWAAKAKQATPQWRIYWDQTWRVINFLILAFFIVKMARLPLKSFLKGQREAVSKRLDEMEQAKAEAEAEHREIQQKIQNLQQELDRYEQALADTAAKEREQMLEEARGDAEIIMQRAQIQAEQALRRARRLLAAEMLDEAASIAAQKIAEVIDDKDRARLVESFASHLDQKAQQAQSAV